VRLSAEIAKAIALAVRFNFAPNHLFVRVDQPVSLSKAFVGRCDL
jgi:hypothetical protein